MGVLRGMIRHKTARGTAALERLKIFEGMPFPYSHKKKRVVPSALKCLRMNRTRKYCRLGDLSAAVGWNKSEVLESLEEKRKARAGEYSQKVKLVNAVKKQAMNLPDVKK